jgi:condensin complex subunit 1
LKLLTHSVKQIIHIELCEAEFKRKKAELEKGMMKVTSTDLLAKQGAADGKADANKEGDDLEMIGGTSEDDFSEAIALIRYFTSHNMADT